MVALEVAGRLGAASRRHLVRRLAIAALLASLAVEADLAAPYVGRAVRSLGGLNLWWLAAALIAQLASMGALARLQRRLMGAGGTWVPARRMLALAYAANAVSVTLPAGTALSTGYSFRRLRRWGATVPLATFTLLASGALSLLAFGLLALLGALIAGAGSTGPLAAVAALAVVVGAIVVARCLLRRPRVLLRLATTTTGFVLRMVHRDPAVAQSRIAAMIDEFAAIRLRRRDWLAALGFAMGNWVGDLVCLLAACRAVGAQASTLGLVTLAYLAGAAVSTVSVLPGGLGAVDAAMILALVHGGVGVVESTAAVLLYRLISLVLVVAAGWGLWLGTWATDRSAAASPVTAPPAAVPSAAPPVTAPSVDDHGPRDVRALCSP